MTLVTFELCAQAPTNGLKGYWPFTKNAIDSAGMNNNGTVYGATLIKDRCGNDSSAYYFDGNDYIDVGTHSSLRSSSKTVSFWFKYTDTTSEMIFVGNYNSLNGEWGMNCRHHDVHGLMTDIGAGSNNRQMAHRTFKTWSDNEWHMFTATYNSKNNKLAMYIDCSLLGYKNWDISGGGFSSSDSIKFYSGEHWIFGASSQYFSSSINNGPRYFTGALDDIRIYDRALSETEVKKMYDGDRCGCTETTYEVVYDTTFVTVYDTNVIDVFDTTYVTINDTTRTNVYDTIFVYDYVTIYDTSYVIVHDTNNITTYDTVIYTHVDTILRSVTDTLYIDVQWTDTSEVHRLKVYPNPTNDKITIDFGEFLVEPGNRVVIYNIIAQKLFDQPVTQRFMEIPLDGLGYSNGHYNLVITNAKGRVLAVRRLILY